MDTTEIMVDGSIDGVYFNVKDALSFQHCFIYIILGNRGCGKTYSCKKHVIDRFIERGEQFAYVRRSEADLDKTNHKFFNDMYELYPDKKFTVKGSEYLCDGVVMGYAYALSTSLAIKGANTPQVSWIIFDEFLIDPNAPYQRYLKEEVYLFYQLYESIARPIKGKKDVPVFLLGNIYTSINPWFREWNIRIPENKRKITTIKEKGIYIQLVDNPKFKEAKRDTGFGRLVAGSSYAETSIDNKFIRDSNEFVLKKAPKSMRYVFTLKVDGLKYGVWLCDGNSFYYVTESYDKNSKRIITTVLDDHTGNTLLVKGGHKNAFFDTLKYAYNEGLIYYDGLLSKNAVNESLWKVG